MDFLRFPLVRFTLWFVAGIAAAHCLGLSKTTLAVAISALFVILMLAYAASRGHRMQKAYFGIAIYVLGFASGVSTASSHHFDFDRNHYLREVSSDQKQIILVTISEKLKQSGSGMRYVATVELVNGERRSGKILLVFRDKQSPRIGTRLIVSGSPIRNKPPKNPGQFDYGRYLDNKAIPAQLFVSHQDFKLAGLSKNIWFYADALRTRIISRLAKKGFAVKELQVLNALILGQQQEIAQEIVRDYQYAGAVHILSVSGLHVGFVLLFVNFILGALPKNKFGNWVRLVCVVLSLWGFAFIAGLSPSVVRSATMFSFIALGMYLRRSTNTFHTLTASLFIILLFEPSFLRDIGFQLSYTAVFFILWLQPVFSGLWAPKNRAVQYFWDILTVSFAAQIGTLPLSLYYFHQFPGLFFVTNLIIIPLVAAIMILGVIVMIFAAVGFVPEFAIFILEKGITTLNWIIAKIASCEEFIFREIPFDVWMMLAFYAAIIVMVSFAKRPTFLKLSLSASVIALLQISVIFSKWKSENTFEFLVFNVPKQTLVVVRNGTQLNVFGHPTRALETYCVNLIGHQTRQQPMTNMLWFGGQKILMVDKAAVLPNCEADVLLLTDSPKLNLDRLFEMHKPKIVVADASNFKSYAKRWERTCRNKKIPFHYTNEKGCFRIGD